MEEFIKKMPKVELHIHLEGAIPPEVLFNFIRESGSNEIKTIKDLEEKFIYSDFDNFIRMWTWKNTFIKKEKDFETIAYEVLKKLALRNVKYVEAFYSPGDFSRQNLSTEGITEALITGKERALKDYNIKCELIVDIIRDHGAEIGMKRVKELTPYLGKGLIGIGMGGNERIYPGDSHIDVYREAKERGFRLTAHAGEVAGPLSVWTAVKKLGVERIGHGVRSKEDPELVSYLKENQLPLEVCVISNLKTGVYKSIKDHPVKELFHKGLMITINSDDPEMFNTNITEEYLALYRELNFTLEDIKKLSINGIKGSFMEEKEKEKMINSFQKEWELLEVNSEK